MRNVKTSYGTMSAEKTESGYNVFAPCGTCIGAIKFYLSVSGKLMYEVKGEIQKTLPAAAKILAAEFYAAKHAAHRAEIEAADADAQAAEQVAAETSAPVVVPTPAKRIVGKADGSAEITTADGVTTIAPRNGECEELEVLEQQHGIEIIPIELPANGVDVEYGIVQNDTEIGVIYFVEGAGYCPLYRSQRAGLMPASGMQPNIGGATEKLMQKIKELGVPENAPKARRPLPEDLQTAQAELAKVDSFLGLADWHMRFGDKFVAVHRGAQIAAFGQFDNKAYIYAICVGRPNEKSLILQTQIGKTLTALPK